jgi:hypothetical protein
LGHKISKVNVQFSHLNVPLPIVFTWWREQWMNKRQFARFIHTISFKLFHCVIWVQSNISPRKPFKSSTANFQSSREESSKTVFIYNIAAVQATKSWGNSLGIRWGLGSITASFSLFGPSQRTLLLTYSLLPSLWSQSHLVQICIGHGATGCG